MNSKPTVQFDGSNDYFNFENGRTDFHQRDKFTVLLVYEDYGSNNWRRIMGNVDHQTGGWCLTMDGSGGNRTHENCRYFRWR